MKGSGFLEDVQNGTGKSLCIDVLAWKIPEAVFTNGVVDSGAY